MKKKFDSKYSFSTRKTRRKYSEDEINSQLKNKDEKVKIINLTLQNENLNKKIKDLNSRNEFLKNQVWDLRKLVKRVGREGFLQIKIVEKEKEKLNQKYDSLKLAYDSLQNNSEHFEKCIIFWKNAINDEEQY